MVFICRSLRQPGLAIRAGRQHVAAVPVMLAVIPDTPGLRLDWDELATAFAAWGQGGGAGQ